MLNDISLNNSWTGVIYLLVNLWFWIHIEPVWTCLFFKRIIRGCGYFMATKFRTDFQKCDVHQIYKIKLKYLSFLQASNFFMKHID